MEVQTENLNEGIIIRSTGSWYRVKLNNGEEVECRLRGKFRVKGIKTTNPVAVGDRVLVSGEENESVIEQLLDRENYILRKSVNLARRAHVLCANVDQAIIVFSVKNPVTTLGYADRLLVTCEAYGVPPRIVFNKTDLLESEEEKQKLQDYREIYQKAGYAPLSINASDEKFKNEAISLLKNKVSVLVGRSGSGKSSLVNLADPGLKVEIGKVSDYSGRGRQTTVFAEMHELVFGGSVIDSPGFKEMEVWDLDPAELSHYFREMRPLVGKCKFNDCLHENEPDCAVKVAVENGEIAASRYNTYLSMLTDSRGQHEHWNRY